MINDGARQALRNLPGGHNVIDCLDDLQERLAALEAKAPKTKAEKEGEKEEKDKSSK